MGSPEDVTPARGRARRSAILIVSVLVLSVAAAGCQTAKAGTRCRGKGFAQDKTYVLQCRKGRWVRIMTKAAGRRALALYVATHPPTTTTTTTVLPPTASALPEVASQVQVVYAIPAGASVDAEIAAGIRNEISSVDGWFATQQGGRGLRFVLEGAETSIKVVNLAASAAELAALGRNDAFNRVKFEIALTGIDMHRNALLVYIDAGVDGFPCGTTLTTGADRQITAILWMAACGGTYPMTTSYWPYGATYLAGHELTHALGATRPCAPHHDGAGHVTDDPRDVIYSGPGPRDWLHLELDPGHDDYYLTGRSDCDVAGSALWEP